MPILLAPKKIVGTESSRLWAISGASPARFDGTTWSLVKLDPLVMTVARSGDDVFFGSAVGFPTLVGDLRAIVVNLQ